MSKKDFPLSDLLTVIEKRGFELVSTYGSMNVKNGVASVKAHIRDLYLQGLPINEIAAATWDGERINATCVDNVITAARHINAIAKGALPRCPATDEYLKDSFNRAEKYYYPRRVKAHLYEALKIYIGERSNAPE